MPLFRTEPPREPSPEPQPARTRSLFSRRSRSQDSHTTNTSSDTNMTRGTNGKYKPTTNGTTGSQSSRSSWNVLRNHAAVARNDPAIQSARQKVSAAEGAEREADRALMAARQAVSHAQDIVRRLEQEAEEEAKRAQAKIAEAKNISSDASHLGRHG